MMVARRPKYSPKAARALGMLKDFYNDIEIFVEDNSCHNVMLFICREILGPTIKLTSLNQLGGRSAVLTACRLDQANDDRRKLYIIDGDFDLLLGKTKPRLKHLHRLRCYCIENLLFDDQSIVSLAAQASPNTPPNVLANKISHDRWMSDLTRTLLPLFIAYEITVSLTPHVPTTSVSVYKLTEPGPQGPQISRRKLLARIRSLLDQVRTQSDWSEIIEMKFLIRERVREFRGNQDYLISGKDYIFPLLASRLGKLVSLKSRHPEVKVRLAQLYRADKEPYLKRRLRAL